MKKFMAFFMIYVLIATGSALAHSGRTDSSGGHYNRETGEYHYHHGYPAHQHTDGICPYDFDDRTGETSGSNSDSSSAHVPVVIVPTTDPTPSATPEAENDTVKSGMPLPLIVSLPIAFIFSIFAVSALAEKISDFRDKRIQQQRDISSCFTNIVDAYKNCVNRIISLNTSVPQLPEYMMIEDGHITSSGLPCTDIFYATKNGASYHSKRTCCRNAERIYLPRMLALMPCSKCVKKEPAVIKCYIETNRLLNELRNVSADIVKLSHQLQNFDKIPDKLLRKAFTDDKERIMFFKKRNEEIKQLRNAVELLQNKYFGIINAAAIQKIKDLNENNSSETSTESENSII